MESSTVPMGPFADELAKLLAAGVAAALQEHFKYSATLRRESPSRGLEFPTVGCQSPVRVQQINSPPPSNSIVPIDPEVDPRPTACRIFSMKTPREGTEASKPCNLCRSAYLKHFHTEIWT
jgi:hypothetical protein